MSNDTSASGNLDILPFALPDMGDEELAAIKKVLDSGWLTTGAVTRAFESELAAAVGAKHAVAVNSCTAAMHLALEAIGLKAEDEVITTPYTFAATAEVIRYFNARPVFVDVEPGTLNIDANLIERAVSPRTKAIIPVHIAGHPVDLDALHELARRHGLHVIEDAAHAFPTTYRDRPIGGLSDFTCFSFYATKTITTGEGGMMCTNNSDWADRCRMMSLHGISRDAWKRYSAEGSWYYEIEAPGFKYNMTDLAAALGRVQLEKAVRMRDRRAEIAAKYTTAFGGQEALEVPADLPGGGHAWHLYMLRIHPDRAVVSREQMIAQLKERGICCSVHFIPLHTHPYYRREFGYQPEDFPVAYREYQREVSLPIYSSMSDGDVSRVIDAVLDVVGSHQRHCRRDDLAA